jgi:hypothetical protein
VGTAATVRALILLLFVCARLPELVTMDSCRLQQIHVEYFQSMTVTEEEICSNGPLDRDRVYVCLVDEAIFERYSFSPLSDLATTLLVTLGSSYLSISEQRISFRQIRFFLMCSFDLERNSLCVLSRLPGDHTSLLCVSFVYRYCSNHRASSPCRRRQSCQSNGSCPASGPIGVQNVTIVDNGLSNRYA